MPESNPGLGQSSTYGQACTQCYKAKCRCVRTASGNACERCIRLKKTCEPSESVRRRNAQTAAADASDMRISRLEDKMETLLSVISSFIGSPGASVSSVNVLQPPNGHTISSSTSDSNGTRVTPTSTDMGFSGGSTFATDSIPAVTPSPDSLLLPRHYPQSPAALPPNQEDEWLNFFRSRMLPFFPFIDLTPDMTCWYLRQNRPFLFQAIRTVTMFSTQERLVQVEELKRLLFTSALLEVQSNIDLLLGLLTYLAWSTDAFLGRADLISRLMMLAISLVYDLRLFKPSSPDVQAMMSITQGRADENSQRTIDETPCGLLERQRAVLACFFLSSNISSHLGRQDALRWTPQMEEALRLLTLNKSCPADEFLASQVRLQLLKQKADEIRQEDEAYFARTGTAPLAVSAPRLLYLETIRRQLHELRSSFRQDLPQLDILNTHAQYVELYINHLAYPITPESLPLDNSGRRTDDGIFLGFKRLDCLWRSVENIKSWLDNFYKIPCSKLVGQPFHFWSQMVLSITLLKYLSTLKDPEWDRQAVRNKVNLISTMDYMCQKLELTSKEPELQCNDHLLKYLSKLLSRCRIWGEARWNMASKVQNVENRLSQGADPDTNRHNYSIPDLDQMFWMHSMDLGNEQWFEDVLGMPSTFF